MADILDAIEDAYPLSRLQAGMLFHSELSPESAIYHDIFSFVLRAAFDRAALERAAQELVARHPLLRTAFDLHNFSEPLQLVYGAVEIPLSVEDLRGHSPEAQRAALAAWRQIEQSRPFGWDQPPLLRFQIHLLTDQTFQFTLSFHHAILDGWSVATMLTELFQIYLAQLGRATPPLPPPPSVGFREMVARERQAIESDESRRFWEAAVGDAEPTLMPRWSSAPPPAGAVRRVARHQVTVPGDMVEALRMLAQGLGVPIKSVLLAAHLRTLSGLAGQPSVMTGLVANGRPETADGERALGLFLNTLPLHVRLEGGSWRDLVRATYRAEQELLPHRHYPLAEIQKLRGGLSLFETAFNFVHFHVYQSLAAFPDLEVLSGGSFEETNFTFLAEFNLNVRARQLQIDLVYDTALLCEEQIAQAADVYGRILAAMAGAPEADHRDFSFLSAQERRRITEGWNATRTEYPREATVHALFAAQAAQTPDATALVFDGLPLSYRELNERANRLAHALRARGVGLETRVALCLRRSPDLLVALLAVLKADAAYVPLDPDYPRDRLAFMLADADVALLLTDTLGRDLLQPVVPTLCLDEQAASLALLPAHDPPSRADAAGLAYVMYTSGSTGQPKGSSITHRSIVRLVRQTAYADFGPDQTFLQFAPVSFDAATLEIWGPLLNGGRLVVFPPHIPSLDELGRFIQEQGITTLWLTAGLFSQMVDEQLPQLRGVRQLLTGGDVVSPAHARRALHELPGCAVINGYGPTENTTFTCCHPMRAPEQVEEPVPIGRPIANTRVHILDGRLQPVPVGVAGDLYAAGDGLARDYHRRPALTAERFIPDPFGQEPGGRLYRTGDQARYRPDGTVEFLGRSDQQVKLRGFRIELGEIEAALAQHPAVRECLVLARGQEPGGRDKQLVAYVVPAPDTALTVTELHAFLKQHLPGYMIPASFVMLEAMPLTANGKIDRSALPALERARPALEHAFEAPRSPVEQQLAELWAEVLRLEQVGIHDNFLELGGDSILSLQIVTRANRQGLRITPRQIFEHPTIADLAAVVGTAGVVQAEQGLVTGAAPLTPIQRWFFERHQTDLHHFNQAVLLSVPPALDPRPLAEALRLVLAHHDALRLRFVPGDGGWQQIGVAPDDQVALEQIDLSLLPADEQPAAIERRADDLQTGLNLSQGPLLRAALFNLGADRPGRLLIIVHHLAIDGVSWRILLEDIQLAYDQIVRGQAPRLPRKTSAFKHWAERLAEYATDDALRAELPFWLDAPPAPALPRDSDAPPEANRRGATRVFNAAFGPEETQVLLQEVSAAYQTQINDLLLTALAQAFAAWTGERTLLVDMEGHGRAEIFEDLDVSRTVGWFTALFPVRLALPDGPDHGAAITGVRDQLRQTLPRGFGYGLLRYLSDGHGGRLAALPQAEVSFNYLGQLDQVVEQSGLFGPAAEAVGRTVSPRGERHYLIEVNAMVAAGQLQTTWIYNDQIHRPETIERLALGFIYGLRALMEHCATVKAGAHTTNDFPDVELTDDQLDRLLAELNL